MDFGTLFGVAGFLVALVSLVYVRTQAAASKVQAEASAEQAGIARQLAELEINTRLADRTFDVRKEMLAQPAVIEAYLRANPQLAELVDRVGGIGALIMLRKMMDAMQDTYLMRKAGIVTDAHWRNYAAAYVPFARMPEFQVVFENAVARRIFDDDFVAFCRDVQRGDAPLDPRRSK